MRLPRTPVVPRVDLDLQILALDEQRRILRREFAEQPGEIAPESVGVESRPRQCTLFDEIGQSRIDGQAGAVEKFGHASTLWSARLRQWTRVRKSVGSGKRVLVRVDRDGRRIIKKKNSHDR